MKPLFIFRIIFFIRFGTKVYGQTIGIPMGTNCAPFDADLSLFCNERDFMKLNKVNSSDNEAPVWDMNLSLSNGVVSTKIMMNRTILILI